MDSLGFSKTFFDGQVPEELRGGTLVPGAQVARVLEELAALAEAADREVERQEERHRGIEERHRGISQARRPAKFHLHFLLF